MAGIRTTRWTATCRASSSTGSAWPSATRRKTRRPCRASAWSNAGDRDHHAGDAHERAAARCPHGELRARLVLEKKALGLAWVDVSTGRLQGEDCRPSGRRSSTSCSASRRARSWPGGPVPGRGGPAAPVRGRDRGPRGGAGPVRGGAPRARRRHVLHGVSDWASAATRRSRRCANASAWRASRASASRTTRPRCSQAAGCSLRGGDEAGFAAHVEPPVRYQPALHLRLDGATVRCLELTETLRGRERNGTLLALLDRCETPPGARKLREWILAPLVDPARIEERLDAVAALVEAAAERAACRHGLATSRTWSGSRAGCPRGRHARDLAASGARSSLAGDRGGRAPAAPRTPPRRACSSGASRTRPLADVAERLRAVLADAPALTPRRARSCARGGSATRPPAGARPRGALRHRPLPAARVRAHGHASLKVGYTKVFGYYLEVTHPHRDKVPPSYIRKQTLKNAERYVTRELQEFEEQVLTARERRRRSRPSSSRTCGRRWAGRRAACSIRPRASRNWTCSWRSRRWPSTAATCGPRPRRSRDPHPRRPAPRGRGALRDRAVRPERPRTRRRLGPARARHHRSEHGGEVDLHPPGGAARPHAQIGSYVPPTRRRSGRGRLFARVGPPTRSPGQEHLHGGDDGDREHPQPRDGAEPGHPRRGGAGTSTYDGERRLGGGRAPPRHAPGAHALRDALPRTHGARGTKPRVRNLNIAVREWRADRLPAAHRAGRERQVLRPARRQTGRRPARVIDRAGACSRAWRRARSMPPAAAVRAPRGPGPLPAGALPRAERRRRGLAARLAAVDLDATTPLAALLLLREWKEAFGEGGSGGAPNSPASRAGGGRRAGAACLSGRRARGRSGSGGERPVAGPAAGQAPPHVRPLAGRREAWPERKRGYL